ncbi:DUF1810 domain-containing protein [Collimonas pratensis]|nr:DUF1810 domain-containing protein [Collimonas pratensis]
MDDQFDLHRFVTAQLPVFDTACQELRTGRKSSHWMWFIFPQIEGLGHSPMAHKFAISSLAEARAYLVHPLLGPRLLECSRLAAAVEDRSAEDIFGYPDYMKFQSCMTLFAKAAPQHQVFDDCLQKYFGGLADAATLDKV